MTPTKDAAELSAERVRAVRDHISRHHEFGKKPGIVQCAYPLYEEDRALFIALADHWLRAASDSSEREQETVRQLAEMTARAVNAERQLRAASAGSAWQPIGGKDGGK
jgi:hypothetical protein